MAGDLSRCSALILIAALPIELPLKPEIAAAQEHAVSPARHPAVRATLEAEPRRGDVRVDGRLDEPAWGSASVASDFVQSYPRPGERASLPTEARILFDEEHLYVGVRLFDSAADSIAAPLARRDTRDLYSDWLHVIVDSRFDRRTAFRFSVNPRGVKRDAYYYDDTGEDDSWTAVWTVATTIDSLGWTAELRIPFSQLRFGGAADDARTWGLQIVRDIARRDERSAWAPWTRSDPGFVSRFGTLTGLEGIPPPRGVELVPYLSAELERPAADPDAPVQRDATLRLQAGADLRVGLPRGLTLSLTINPDFGQVEADPAEVNLTAFETFLEERRPFFTEGADVFRFGEPRALVQYGIVEPFYSRRIGRAPQRQLLDGEYAHVDAPRQTRILGAAKLSGRTPDGWSVGIMNVLTNHERATLVADDGNTHRTTVEPPSNYLVGRLRRHLGDGSTVVGGFLTSTHRDLDEAVAPLLHRSAHLVGADLLHSWAEGAWRVTAHLAGSQVSGRADAVATTQRDAMRYFQRPDAGHLVFDPERTSLEGHVAELSLVRTGSWEGSLELKQVSPGFEINDLGFLGRADSRSAAAFLGRRVDRTAGILQSQNYWVALFQAWNFAGDQILSGGAGNADVRFSSLWRAGLGAAYRPEYADDRLTRGGPLSTHPAQREISGWIQSDSRRAFSVRADTRRWWNTSGASERSVGLSLELRPSAALRVQLRPTLERQYRTAQFVRAAVDSAAVRTFGRRYVFAELDQTTAAAELRLDWTFSTALSLQLFMQPFVSAGRFDNFKEFTTPGRFAFATYGADQGTICGFEGLWVVDPDLSRDCPSVLPPAAHPRFSLRFADPSFTLRSLRGNAVLRWEYRRGSTLFFVWQQDRHGFVPDGRIDIGRDTHALLGGPADHVFLIKVSYWFGR